MGPQNMNRWRHCGKFGTKGVLDKKKQDGSQNQPET